MRGAFAQFKTNFKSNWAALSLMLTIPILSISYVLLNNDNGGRAVHSLVTRWDEAIPFLKIFIMPYMLWYPVIFGALYYVCVRDRATYYQTLLSLDIGLMASYLIFYFYQTTVPRPDLAGDDPLTAVVRLVYAADQPFNCFPSIHVLTSYLVMRAVNHSPHASRMARFVVSGASTLIILSTLFVKQHVLLDAAGAILIGELLFRLVGFMTIISAERRETSGERDHTPS